MKEIWQKEFEICACGKHSRTAPCIDCNKRDAYKRAQAKVKQVLRAPNHTQRVKF